VATNYGFNIGGGGLADLVQTPKVTPVRGMQFAPTPRLPREQEKDSKKQLLGALLGSASPFLGDLALKGIAQIPGAEKFFYKDDPTALAAEIKPEDILTDTEIPEGQTSFTAEQLREKLRQGRLAEIDKSAPALKTPQVKTIGGEIVSRILGYSPGLALGDEDDGSVPSFLTTAGQSQKLLSALEQSRVESAVDRSQLRAREFAEVDPKLTQVTVNGWKDIDGKLVGYQTRALRDENGVTWIESRGDQRFDVQQGTNEVVPKGQYYRNTQMTMLDGEIGEVATDTFQDSGGRTDGQLYEVSLIKGMNPKTGQPFIERRVMQDDGSYRTVAEMKQDGYNLVSQVDLTTERAVPGKLKTNDQKRLDDFVLRRDATRNLVSLATQIMDRLGMKDATVDDEGNIQGLDEAITTGSSEYAAKFLDIFDRNVRMFGSKLAQIYGMEGSDQTSIFDEFVKRNVDPDSGAKGLADALNYYQTALESQDQAEIDKARSFLIDDLQRIKDTVGTDIADSPSSWLNFDKNELQTYLQDTGFYGAAQIRLAFLMASARGESLSRISDRDVALNLQTMGFEDGNPAVVVDKLGGAIFDAIQNTDRENASSSTLRKIDLLTGMSIDEQRVTLENIRDDFAAQYNLDVGPDSDVDRLYNSNDPVEIGRLRRKIRGDAQRNTGGVAKTTFVYDPKLQMFLPATVAREILGGENPEFSKFGNYLMMLKYNLRTGTTPGKRSTVPGSRVNRSPTTTVGDVQTTGAFSKRAQDDTP
jgi:hypothetical protein|tara:strand:- start:111 stop:2381 length:2271 start_codon:yes stop_codon:yes gene_type:complete